MTNSGLRKSKLTSTLKTRVYLPVSRPHCRHRTCVMRRQGGQSHDKERQIRMSSLSQGDTPVTGSGSRRQNYTTSVCANVLAFSFSARRQRGTSPVALLRETPAQRRDAVGSPRCRGLARRTHRSTTQASRHHKPGDKILYTCGDLRYEVDP